MTAGPNTTDTLPHPTTNEELPEYDPKAPRNRHERRILRERANERKKWADVISRVAQFAIVEGLAFEERNPCAPEYQLCRLAGDGVRLVVYPHRQTNAHQHARVRDEGSKDKVRASDLIAKLGLKVKHGVLPDGDRQYL